MGHAIVHAQAAATMPHLSICRNAMEDVKVSIICDTYNQGDYIEDALKSFIAQETTFAFEVLVHDDASTDCTAEVIARYAEQYPDIIKPYYEEVNQYTPSGPHNYQVQSARARGKYIAFCEGDDYWTDPRKLQLQYEILEQHPEVDICAHSSVMVRPDTKEPLQTVRPRQQDCIIPVEDVISGGGGFVMTNTIFMRAETYLHPPKIVTQINFDYLTQISGAWRGGMYYLDRCMSAYRLAAKGSFTSRVLKSKVKSAEHLKLIIDALNGLDEETGRVHTATIQRHVDELMVNYNAYLGRLGDAFRTDAWKAMPLKAKLGALPRMLLNGTLYRLEKLRSR